MREAYEALRLRALRDCGKIVFSDETSSLSREELLQRVGALARELSLNKKAIGILASNGVAWAVAQLAGAVAGKTVVPLPTFFSAEQLGHIIRDADIGLILCSDEFRALAAPSGVAARPIDEKRRALPVEFREGFQANHLYVWKHGPPQGRATWWPSNGMVDGGVGRGERRERKRFISFDSSIAAVARDDLRDLHSPAGRRKDAFFKSRRENLRRRTSARRRDHVRKRQAEFQRSRAAIAGRLGRRIDSERHSRSRNLAFRRGGGRPAPKVLVEKAWALGIPVHEGYGLSECCSVVALNRCGARKAGTVGQPLAGLRVSIEEREIVVEGPSLMDGYLGGPDVGGRWRTGDLGEIDAEGCLIVHGRKDNLLITSFGRNISPEWIETLLLGDHRIAFCAVLGHGEPHLSVLLVPTAAGTEWFMHADRADVLDFIACCCVDAPSYAVPKDFFVLSLPEVTRLGLLTSNGRFRRKQVADYFEKWVRSAS